MNKVDKSIVIWGNGDLGKHVYRLLVKNNYCVRAFVESDCSLIGKIVEGIPVISYQQLNTISNDENITVLLALKNSYNIVSVMKKLDKCKIENIGIIKPRILVKLSLNSIEDEEMGDIVWVKKEQKLYKFIPRLELNIVDGCNLRCKGCSHFANLFSKDSLYPIKEYEHDLKQIRKIGKMVRLRLLGGEPFLAENLVEYISISRDVFPEADIELVTNGLLIPKTKKNILEKIQVNNILVSISPYYPTLKMKTEIERILKEAQIWWKFEVGNIDEFSKKLTLEKSHNGKIASESCLARGCIFLKNGKIYKCPLEGLVFVLEKKFDINLDVTNRGITIYDNVDTVYNSIQKLIINPVEMCQYCLEENDNFKWEIGSEPLLKDWIGGTES